MRSFMVTSYGQASGLLTGRCKNSRKIQRNTYVQRKSYGNDIAVRLHSTDVVTYHKNGDVSLSTGGWTTTTTKDRIQSYTPGNISLWSERGVFFLTAHGQTVPFADGIRIKASGEIKGATETVMSVKAAWRESDRIQAKISRWRKKAKHGEPAPKLTLAKIADDENQNVRLPMILCYGLARYLQDAGVVIEQSPEFTFLRKEIDRWHAIAGMKDAEGTIIVVGGECRNLADAREWYSKTAANALVNRGQGSTEGIVRAELLRSL